MGAAALALEDSLGAFVKAGAALLFAAMAVFILLVGGRSHRNRAFGAFLLLSSLSLASINFATLGRDLTLAASVVAVGFGALAVASGLYLLRTEARGLRTARPLLFATGAAALLVVA